MVVVLVGLSLGAAACSTPPKTAAHSKILTGPSGPGSSATKSLRTGTTALANGPAGPATTAVQGAITKSLSQQGAGGPGQSTGTTLIGVGDKGQAQAVGSKIYPQSTTRGPSGPGVGANTIQLDFSVDATECGANPADVITAAGGALPTSDTYANGAPTTPQANYADNQRSISTLVQYFNQHGFDVASYFPNVRKYMGNDPNNQWFGRHFNYNIIDGGSFQCPDKTTAAAAQAVDQDHAFAVFNNFGTTGQTAYNMAAALNSYPANVRPMHFGTLWGSDSLYQKYAPFDWTQFATGTTIAKQQASYICSELVGHDATNSAQFAHNKRVFGFVHPNQPQVEQLATEFKGYLQSDCGRNIIVKEVTYNSTDLSSAETDSTNMIIQLKAAGVTSVIMMTDPLFPLFQLDAAKQQNYFPEWVFSSYGYEDTSTVQRIYDQTEAAGSFGVSELGIFGGFAVDPGDAWAIWHTYHPVDPQNGQACNPANPSSMNNDPTYCKEPSSLVTWYYTMLDFIGGTLFSGPTLTAQNVTNGLQSYPPTRYGSNGPTTNLRPALVQGAKGDYGFIKDAVAWKYEPGFTSPPPENKKGWVSYPNCERHYILWPNDLSAGWGGNVSAYCNQANGYPPGPYTGF
ncbi:MAG: type 1 periplasmic-binding domain-containing protein [Acidimicrobiales bacterium]